MSDRTVAPPAHNRMNWALLGGAWAIAAAIYTFRAIRPGAGPLYFDTDDAMRLTEVRDLLNGQGWFDLVQHRLNTPWGAEIHWSRLVDLPIAGLIAALRPAFGPQAETIASFAWPLGLALVMLWLCARLSVRLAGPDGMLPGVVLPLLSSAVLVEFGPGRLDHHSVQIILTLALAWTTIEAWKRPGFAVAAGLLAATSLAVGTEGLPQVVAAIVAVALMWSLDSTHARTLRGFGLSFAGAMMAYLVVALPPSSWLRPMCDAISIVYVLAAVATGLAFAGLSLARLSKPLHRLAAAVVAGLVVAALVVGLYPQCLAGPYAGLDPWLVEHWIGRITEALPVWTSLAGLPAYTVGMLVPLAIAAVGVPLAAWRDRPRRGEWLVLGLFLVVAVAVTVAQVRGARLAACLAVPAGAWLIAAARRRYLERRHPGYAGLLLAAWLGFAGLALSLAIDAALPKATAPGAPAATGATIATRTRADCFYESNFAALAALPVQSIMTPIDLGSHVLAFTPHSVVAAPYHRNQRGVRDAIEFFNLPIEQARARLDERRITLVVTCPYLAEMGGMDGVAADSFVRLAARGALPDWLVKTSPADSVLEVYAVRGLPHEAGQAPADSGSNLATPIGQLTPVPARPQ
jgi:hypothetical protein